MAPKMISGRVKARPIWSHCPKDWFVPLLRLVTAARFRQRHGFVLVRGRLEAAALLAVLGPGVVHRAQGAAQFLAQFRRIPGARIDRFEQFEMLAETFAGGAELLHFFLGVVGFTLEHDERAGQLVGHLGAAVFQFFLAATELLQLALLFFDLFLLALELEQLLLRFLHLGIQMLGTDTVVFV